MTLENLLGTALESIQKDAANVSRLLAAAKRSLADAKLAQMSSEGRFDMAYKAIMQAANAALQASGFRTLTSKPGHHVTMIQCGDPVSEAMANEAVAHAQRLLAEVEAGLKHENLYRLCENVTSDDKTRQKQAKKRSLGVLNEHFSPVFNAVLSSAVVFTQSV